MTAVSSAICAFCSGVAKSWPIPSPELSTWGRFLVSCSNRLDRSSGVGARSTARAWVRATMWSRSHGTAVNCTRCVSSCMATHRRKSVGSTCMRRSAATMFGATSSRRGVPPGARSYCPSTLLERKASSPPISAPVTLPPIAAAVALVDDFFVALSLSTTGSSIALNESTLTLIQPARSTTRASGASAGAVRALVSATGPMASAAAARRSATIAAASSLETCGPGLTTNRPVRFANS